MLGTIVIVIVVLVMFVVCTHLVSTKDRRMDYIENERIKRERDLFRWM